MKEELRLVNFYFILVFSGIEMTLEILWHSGFQSMIWSTWGNSSAAQWGWNDFYNNMKVVFDLGEGNGTPLQYSCLENPMDGGAW